MSLSDGKPLVSRFSRFAGKTLVGEKKEISGGYIKMSLYNIFIIITRVRLMRGGTTRISDSPGGILKG